MTTTRHPIPWLGLTGGIGSGKSTALAYLHECGAAVISSDDVVHGLLSRRDIVDAVRGHFGDGVVADGDVDRAALGRIVFEDVQQLQWLEALLHPNVRVAVEAWARAQLKVKPRPALIAVEVPLLFESGMETLFDAVMLITAPAGQRRRRVAAKLTDSDFARRLAQQMPEDEKRMRSRFVYDNAGSRKALREFVGQSVAQLLADDAAVAGGAGVAPR